MKLPNSITSNSMLLSVKLSKELYLHVFGQYLINLYNHHLFSYFFPDKNVIDYLTTPNLMISLCMVHVF